MFIHIFFLYHFSLNQRLKAEPVSVVAKNTQCWSDTELVEYYDKLAERRTSLLEKDTNR